MRVTEDPRGEILSLRLESTISLNPFFLEDSLPEVDFSTRPGGLETVPSRSISYAGLSRILVFSLVTHSDLSGIVGLFSSSWYYL